MIFVTKLLLVAVVCACSNEADPNINLSSTAIPLYMWPMNGIYQGREVKQFTFSLNPANLNHTHVVDSEINPLLEKTSLYFHHSDYLDFSLTTNIQFESVAVSLFVRPEKKSSDCTFFHYKAQDTSTSNNEIVEIRGHADNSYFTFDVLLGNHQTETIYMEVSDAYELANFVTFVYSSQTSKLHLFIGKEHKSVTTESASLKLLGTLRFGGHLSDNQCGFHGEIFCAALFDLGTGIKREHYEDLCNNMEWPEPVLLWPLNKQCEGYEVRTHQSPTYFSVDPLRYLYTNTGLFNSSIRFDGSFLSSIASKIPPDLLHQQFTLAMYILLDDFSDGTILYTSRENSLALTVVNASIVLSLYNTVEERQPCLEISSTNSLTKHEWGLVLVMRAFNLVHLTVGNNVDSNYMNNCWSSRQSTSQSQIIFGAQSEGDEGFKGGLTCVGVYNYSSSDQTMSERLTELCSSTSNMSNTTHDELTAKSVLQRTSTQNLVGLTHKPPNTINQIYNGGSKSLSDCGRKCLETVYCRSYTYTRQNSTCCLYDVFIKNQLITEEGVKYFLVKRYQ